MSIKLEKIKDINKMLEELKDENYIIRNKVLEEKDEYKKFLYINMLCTVIQYDNEPSKEQISFLNRIVKGICCENKKEYYMRKALETDGKILKEFVDEYKETERKYYFALDGIILINLTKESQKNYEYLGELIEVLGITQKEADYISQIAKSVLLQDSEVYENAKEIKNKNTENLNFIEYIKNYFTGRIVNTDTDMYIYSADQSEIEFGGRDNNEYYDEVFYKRNIVFDNLKINFLGGATFRGCEKVTFKNCDITAVCGNLVFNGVGNINIENSKIHNIYDRAMELNACDNLSIYNSEIFDCDHIKKSVYYNSLKEEEIKKILGPVGYYINVITGGFAKISGNSFNSISIVNSKISDLLLKSTEEYNNYKLISTGSFMHIDNMPINEIHIENSEFYGCRATNSKREYLDVAAIYCRKPNELILENNICSGGTSRLIETY